MKKINLFFAFVFFALLASAQTTSTFDTLTLGVDTFYNGSDFSGGFTDGKAYFENQYDTVGGYDSWSGFSYSDKTDSVTQGYTNQYSAVTAGGYNGSSKYAVGYDDGYGSAVVRLAPGAAHKAVQGVYVTNTTYAYKDMLLGDNFGNLPFTADSSDFLLLHITGWSNGAPIKDTVNFYLANFTLPDTTQNYFVKNWQWVNLLALGNADSLVFSVTGSRNNSYGLETPAYFAIDNFVTSDLATIYDTIYYNVDTLINVLSGVTDTAGGPFTVKFVSNLTGASVAVDSANRLWYIPQSGIAGNDVVTYVICNASNQCDTAQVVFTLLSPTGINELNTLQTTVYPNPFSASLTISHPLDVKTINLYDLAGRLICTTPCTTGELTTNIQTADLAAGTYLVKVISAEGTGIAKVIKQ